MRITHLKSKYTTYKNAIPVDDVVLFGLAGDVDLGFPVEHGRHTRVAATVLVNDTAYHGTEGWQETF